MQLNRIIVFEGSDGQTIMIMSNVPDLEVNIIDCNGNLLKYGKSLQLNEKYILESHGDIQILRNSAGEEIVTTDYFDVDRLIKALRKLDVNISLGGKHESCC